MSFDLEEPAMFKMGGVMGGAYVHSLAEHAVEWVLFEVLFDEEDEIDNCFG